MNWLFLVRDCCWLILAIQYLKLFKFVTINDLFFFKYFYPFENLDFEAHFRCILHVFQKISMLSIVPKNYVAGIVNLSTFMQRRNFWQIHSHGIDTILINNLEFCFSPRIYISVARRQRLCNLFGARKKKKTKIWILGTIEKYFHYQVLDLRIFDRFEFQIDSNHLSFVRVNSIVLTFLRLISNLIRKNCYRPFCNIILASVSFWLPSTFV